MKPSKMISTCLTDELVRSGRIGNRVAEAYEFCFEYIFDTLFFISSILLGGFLLGNIKSAMLFLLVFYPLRKIGGGAHLNSAKKCTAFSYLISFAIILIPWQFVMSGGPEYLIFAFSSIIILVLTPVDHPNLRYTVGQKKHLKRWMFVDILVISVILGLSVYFGDDKDAGMLVICAVVTAFNQLAGRILDWRGYYEA